MEFIRFEKNKNIAVITISREKALNALNTQVLQELDAQIDEIEKRNDIYCVIVTGSGSKSFIAGADISEMKDLDTMEAAKFSAFGNRVFRKLEQLCMPVIAAINGFALGGGLELALACDIRIASENALFGQPETSLGITPGYGGTQRLQRIVGIGMAKKLIYTSAQITPNEALRIGLINEIAPKSTLMDTAIKIAQKIARQAPIAVANSKKAINEGANLDIDSALKVEADLFAKCFSTEDQKDAMDAFLRKERLSKFKNR